MTATRLGVLRAFKKEEKKSAKKKIVRVNAHNLAQAANWRSLVKTSLELQSCPLFQINIDQNPLGLLPLAKSINLKEGTRLQL
jgi:hypothetical protein